MIAHVQKCLGKKAATSLRWELELFRSQGNDIAAEALRQSWFARMWDISQYMKVLKQRFCPRSAHATPLGNFSSEVPFLKAA